jgi:hypothetical protein
MCDGMVFTTKPGGSLQQNISWVEYQNQDDIRVVFAIFSLSINDNEGYHFASAQIKA